MIQNLKFPLIYLLELLLWLPVVAGSFIASLFFRAKPITSIELQGKSLPSHWEAAVYSHGMYLPGYKIQENPIAFGVVIFLVVIFAIAIYLVKGVQKRQRNNAKSAEAGAHKLANSIVFVAVGAIGYFFVMHVFVGVAPA